MANTRFVLSDYCDPITYSPTLLNAPDTATGYSAANIFTRDRHTIWKCGSTGVGTFDIDLGTTYSIDNITICGEDHESWGGTAGPAVTVYHSDDGVAWTSAGTLAYSVWVLGRNAEIQLSAAVSKQYWRIVFTATSSQPFSIGKLFIGNDTDLGFAYSPGTTMTITRQRTRHSVNGALAIHEVGPAYRRWAMQFNRGNAALYTTLSTLIGLGRPFVYIDKASRVSHVELDDDVLTRSHVAGDASIDVYDMTLNLVELV